MKSILKKMFKILILCLVLFPSCMPADFEGNYYYIIENNSDSSVYLNYITISKVEKSRIINQHTIDTVLKEWALNAGEDDLGNEFLTEWLNAFNIYSDSLHQNQIQKNYNERNNWEYHSVSHGNKKRSNGDNYYTLKLINSDI